MHHYPSGRSDTVSYSQRCGMRAVEQRLPGPETGVRHGSGCLELPVTLCCCSVDRTWWRRRVLNSKFILLFDTWWGWGLGQGPILPRSESNGVFTQTMQGSGVCRYCSWPRMMQQWVKPRPLPQSLYSAGWVGKRKWVGVCLRKTLNIYFRNWNFFGGVVSESLCLLGFLLYFK